MQSRRVWSGFPCKSSAVHLTCKSAGQMIPLQATAQAHLRGGAARGEALGRRQGRCGRRAERGRCVSARQRSHWGPM